MVIKGPTKEAVNRFALAGAMRCAQASTRVSTRQT